jgi:hypothetical protein
MIRFILGTMLTLPWVMGRHQGPDVYLWTLLLALVGVVLVLQGVKGILGRIGFPG